MLSCNRIESAKFILGTQSPAKLVYYTGTAAELSWSWSAVGAGVILRAVKYLINL